VPRFVVAVVPRDNTLLGTRGLVPADLEKQIAIRLAIGSRPGKDAVAHSRELVVARSLEAFDCCNRNRQHSARPSMVAMGLDVVALMGRVNRSGRVERTLQAIAIIAGIDENGNYRLNYLYRAEGEQSTPVFEEAYRQMKGLA